jgi:hypothetical protein
MTSDWKILRFSQVATEIEGLGKLKENCIARLIGEVICVGLAPIARIFRSEKTPEKVGKRLLETHNPAKTPANATRSRMYRYYDVFIY